MDTFARELDKLMGTHFDGLRSCDLEDVEIRAIERMRRLGLSAEEVVTVMREERNA